MRNKSSFIKDRLRDLKSIAYHRLKILSGEKGFGLVESLIAVAIVGSAVIILIGGITTGTLSVGRVKENTYAETLGRSQLEYTKSLPYNTAPFSYQSMDNVPSGYSITAEASAITGKDTNIQKITVTVYRGGDQVYVLEGYKVNR